MGKECVSKAFTKYTPTAFIIESPFQLLCAWEAIGAFEISEYRIVLVIDRGNIRNKQTLLMLQDINIGYDLYYTDELTIDSKNKDNRVYERIMVGDYDDLNQLKLVEKYANNHSEVVFMDDGLSSIMILKGLPYNHSPFLARIRKLIKGEIGIERARQEIFEKWRSKGITNNYSMYTIYDNVKSKKFKIFPNKLSHLANRKLNGDEVVIIVGTTIIEMAEELDISVPLFEGLLWTKLAEVREKFPNKRIIYIPHGRDKDPHIEQLCKCLEIEFKRIQMSIEYYIIKEDFNVVAVYGVLSTALYTLKKITGASVTHWALGKKKYKHVYLHTQYTKYYEEMGIITDKIQIPHLVNKKI